MKSCCATRRRGCCLTSLERCRCAIRAKLLRFWADRSTLTSVSRVRIFFEELHPSASSGGYKRVTEIRREYPSRRIVISASPATVSATPPARRNLSVSRETRRGPTGTVMVPLGPRHFAAQTLVTNPLGVTNPFPLGPQSRHVDFWAAVTRVMRSFDILA